VQLTFDITDGQRDGQFVINSPRNSKETNQGGSDD